MTGLALSLVPAAILIALLVFTLADAFPQSQAVSWTTRDDALEDLLSSGVRTQR